MFSKILVPVDFSDYTEEILGYAQQMAGKFGSELHLLHVIASMAHLTHYESFLASESVIAIEKGIAEGVDRQMAALVGSMKGVSVVTSVRTGAPFVEIIDYVRENGIDLIVMGTHGRGGLEHILIGSVAEKVVRKAPCPVLTIRPKDRQFKMP